MADKSNKYEDNAPGKFYVDQSCIACDNCCMLAGDYFKMNEDGSHALLAIQPTTPEGETECKEAMNGCPVEAIGNDDA